MPSKNKIKLPNGSEILFFEEAYIHRKLTESLQDLFTSWGYLPVKTPVFDLYDAYSSLIQAENVDKIFRLIDRDGDLLMLRSDVTLFLARQMGLLLSENELPVRVCYADSILRHQDSHDISHNEFFQSGVELIGKPGIEGDLEILLLLKRTIDLLDIPVEIHLGSRGLFNKVFSSFDEKEKTLLLNMISLREFDQLKEFCSEKMEENDAAKSAELFSYIGDSDNLDGLKDENTSAEIDYLIKIFDTLKKAKCSDHFHIDLGEIGSQSYHTGIAFQVYMKGVASAVISGGRYDSLLSNFGINAPSVGFSILQRKVEPGLRKKERFESPKQKIQVNEDDMVEKFSKAEKLRKEGKIITL